MSAGTIRGLVLVEPALPLPIVMVTTRAGGREDGRFFECLGEARTYAAEIAKRRGLMLVDLIAATEGEVAE